MALQRRYLIMFALLVAVLAACAPESAEPLPTLAVLPTLEPSATPTETLTPTITPTATATDTPTLTPTPTNTATATITPSPTNTALPTATPTFTITPTFTATATSTATATATLSATPNTPSILSYQASADTAQPGQSITLTWNASADSARIERLNQAGNIVETFPVTPTGQAMFTIPGGERVVIFRLVAARGGSETSLSISISVQVVCNPPWFFANPPADIGCPTAAALGVPGTFQTFERGFMFRIQLPGVDKVCGIQNDRNRYACYNYAAYTGTPPATPPTGFQGPAVELQDAFYNQLAIGGFWYTIIGWGTTAPIPTTYSVQYDTTGRIYISTPLGAYRFDGALTSGDVRRLP